MQMSESDFQQQHNEDGWEIIALDAQFEKYSPTIFGFWFGTLFILPYLRNFIIPTDFHILSEGLVYHQPDGYIIDLCVFQNF